MTTDRSHLDGAGFVQLVRAGHARLKAQVDVVNALNVFPVPDGDTGTNMELSLASGVSSLATLANPSLGQAASALAAGLLMGARGNSGVILSQLFRGFSRVLADRERLDAALFARALQEGVDIAYRAVAKPVEGTMLTVAREAAATGVREAKRNPSLPEWMARVLQAARDALAKTPEQLPVLKQAGVVDSGGQGLVFILEGFDLWLRGETPAVTPQQIQAAAADAAGGLDVVDFAAAHVAAEGEYGYCTEVLVRARDAQRAESALRYGLAAYGNSLLVVSAGDLVKVHVHTLHPGRVLEDALTHGDLLKVKVDNMTEQHAVIRAQAGAADGAQHPRAFPEAAHGSDEASSSDAVRVSEMTPVVAATQPGPPRPSAVVAVVAGEGLQAVFRSLGVDVLVSGGQTMNPSTQEILDAARAARGEQVILLPNNKNVVLAAEQAAQMADGRVHVIPTTSVPQGIAAMMAFLPSASANENVARMRAAMAGVRAGSVARAARDTVYQDREVKENQYLGLVDQDLVCVADSREQAFLDVVAKLCEDEAELVTVFYGADVAEDEVHRLADVVSARFGAEVEAKAGGQPVYDYILSVE
ncbi:DAK2 domain-containing protein [Alicyclobacillus sp.]|uniref:DAK2 domain-containing protein n=1 Tax=Alicyclobacillus sp. TaxID=61169 RepID=UPI0025C1C5CC|nr:DAK2 domain-containing protein [Alicyclobacillus sp.]MCL6516432.1 DAK2 domain-containing protein [Alicyclobacillus sp.]